MFKSLLQICILISFLSVNIFAYEKERALQNLADDYAVCTSFFMISAEGMKNSNDIEMEKKLDSMALYTYELTTSFSNEETAKAKILLNRKDMLMQMDYHYSNFSRLLLKYSDFCKELLEKPEKRTQYWLDKN